jgi:hypothetical protein
MKSLFGFCCRPAPLAMALELACVAPLVTFSWNAAAIAAETPEPVVTGETPESFISRIYHRIASGKGDQNGSFVWADPASRDKYFSASLAGLWREAEAAAPEGDALIDFDPLTNSQDSDVQSFTLTSGQHNTPYKAAIAVTIAGHPLPESAMSDGDLVEKRNPEDAVIRYDIVWENKRFRIDNIHGSVRGKKWSLREILAGTLESDGRRR